MLDPKFIRENIEKVKLNTQQRGGNPNIVDTWLEVDKQKLDLIQNLNEINRQKNELAEKQKTNNILELRQKGADLKQKSKKIEEALGQLEIHWQEAISQIPNIHLANVPIGKNDNENVVLREVGKKTEFSFPKKDHITLGQELDLLDFEAGAKVAGSQFYYLKNDAVRLEFALIQFGIDFLSKKGFTPVVTPDLAKSRYYLGTGYAPRGDEAQTYEIKGEDLGLIATAEVTMAALHADEIIKEKDLPLKYAAISHCYRKEAGAYGKYSKGLYRVHQFTKLEMFVYCLPEDSIKIHEELREVEEEIAKTLEIPYRVVEMCSGDLGSMAAKKYDLEAWMPGREDYGEITSTSNCTDYQARNLNIRVEREDGKKEFVHMLNGTAIVMSRFPIAILENFQQADGSVKIPKALEPYMGKNMITKP